MKNVVQIAAPVLAGIMGFWIGRIGLESEATGADPGRRVTEEKASETSPGSAGDDPMLISVITALRSGSELREIARAGEILGRMDSTQMRALMDLVEKWPARERDRWLPRLIDDWTRADPESATEWMKPRLAAAAVNSAFGSWYDCERETIEAWVERAPERAIEYARTVSRTALAGVILGRAVNRLPDLGIPERLKILLGFPDGDGRDRAFQSFFSSWSHSDPEATFAAAASLPSGKAQDAGIAESLTHWVEKDPTAILAKVSNLGISEPGVLGLLAHAAAKSDPVATGRWLAERNPAALPTVGVVVAKSWAQRDPAAAFAWAMEHGISLTASPDSRALNAPEGVSWTLKYEMDSESPFQAALSSKREEALAWLGELPVGTERDQLTEMAVRGSNEESMESLYRELPPDAAIRCAGTVASRLAAKDIERATAWASGLDDPAARAAAWKGIGSGREEPLPISPGPERDAMLTGMALISATSKPEAAFARMLEIADPTRRRETFDDMLWRVFREPIEFAPGMTAGGTPESTVRAVREWVKNSPVPDEWKRDWRRRLEGDE